MMDPIDPRCFIKDSQFYNPYLVRKASWYIAVAVWRQNVNRREKVQFT